MHTPQPVTLFSADITAERIAALKELIPEAFTEGKIDFTKLRQALGDIVDDGPERYNFTWAGKRDAIRTLQAPTAATLVPCPEESVNWESTQHLILEGDNLEVLKLLNKAYSSSVKLIYIDPPYNTGNDFIYPDDFSDPLRQYLQVTRQMDATGFHVSSNTEASGRFHSRWLNMMYPRLFFARNLLREDGVIFISVDDNEVDNLKKLCNEVFGEENFITSIAWQRRDTPANDAQYFSSMHEHILLYARQYELFTRNLLPRSEQQLSNYKNPDNDPRGVWTRNALTRPGASERDTYSVRSPDGRIVVPPKGTSWRVSRSTFDRLIAENRVWWGKGGDGSMPFQKRFLSEVQDGVVPTTWWDYTFAGSNRNAKMELREFFADPPFDYPKPSQLIRRMIEIAADRGDVIMDFFAGSGTTAQAVLELNELDNGSRRYILVQLPEPIGRDDFATISEITKERVRRVSMKLAGSENSIGEDSSQLDHGFRVFKLATSRFQGWSGVSSPTPTQYIEQMRGFGDLLFNGFDPHEVVWEVAIKEGYPLASHVNVKLIHGHTVYCVTDLDAGRFFHICLDNSLEAGVVNTLQLAKDDLFVCRDIAIDDTTAANLALNCRLKTI